MATVPGNAALLRTLAMHADDLAVSVSREKFPILLRKLAERRLVISVEFRPLLVDAMLISNPHGFRVLFNSGTRDPEELETQYYGETVQQLADTRTRFSLAHEFAHTLFYDLTLSPPKIAKSFRAGGGKTALENLERNCDQLAAYLLLPTRLFNAAVLEMKEISVEGLRGLAVSAGVSMEVVIRRLASRSDLLRQRYFFGCIAIVKERANGLVVQAVSTPKHLNIVPDLQLIHPGEKWQLTNSRGELIDVTDPFGIKEVLLATGAERGPKTKAHRMEIAVLDRFHAEATYLVILEQTSKQ